jgi:hypothetical protein
MTDISSTQTELEALADRLSQAAVTHGFTACLKPELVGATLKAGEGLVDATLSPSDLPSEAVALVFDRYSFVLTRLPETYAEPAIVESVRRFRNQCVVARSYLAPDQALDLQGILVGPRGSDISEDWRAMALVIERDERVARKFVWLRPADPKEDAISFETLLSRSVLARPWESDAQFVTGPLDDISGLAAEADAEVSRDLMGDWIQLAITTVDKPDRLVDGLIQAARERGVL